MKEYKKKKRIRQENNKKQLLSRQNLPTDIAFIF